MFICSITLALLSIGFMIKNSIYGCGKRCYKTRKEAQENCDYDQQVYMCWECETWHIKNNGENT